MKTRTITSGIRSLVRMEPLIGKIIVFFVLLNLQYFRNEIVFLIYVTNEYKASVSKLKLSTSKLKLDPSLYKITLTFHNPTNFWNMKV